MLILSSRLTTNVMTGSLDVANVDTTLLTCNNTAIQSQDGHKLAIIGPHGIMGLLPLLSTQRLAVANCDFLKWPITNWLLSAICYLLSAIYMSMNM